MKRISAVFITLLMSLFLTEASTFEKKGFYVDCRHEVMTIDALKDYVSHLSKLGMNTLIMEYEATFPFEKHATLCNEYAFTKQEIEEFVAYCAALGVEVIPLQNCFGHAEYILRHDRYAFMKELHGEYSQVCPMAPPAADDVFREIFEEIAALHPSKYFHIGADETRLLGRCPRCRKKVQEEGVSALFVDYVNRMADIVISMGKTPIIWDDMLLQHPEALSRLREGIILLDWNYGWDVSRFGDINNLLNSDYELWGATAMRSHPDQIHVTQWRKHLDNLTSYIPFAREAGFHAIINTSWSTSGQYGFHYDGDFGRINNMQPIRSVFPQKGMNLLVEAFCSAVNDNGMFDAESFVRRYAKEHFGFSAKDSDVLWAFINVYQDVVTGSGTDSRKQEIETLIQEMTEMQKQMYAMNPKYNADEFADLVLMIDLRLDYLHFRRIELQFNADSFDKEHAKSLYEVLTAHIDQSKYVGQRFVASCEGYLKKGQAETIDAERMEAKYHLLAVLKNMIR